MSKKIRVLLACEESQTVCRAFRARGYAAFSCDIEPTTGKNPAWHLMGDVRNYLDKNWDLIIAFPPCTRLANSGGHWLERRNLWDEMEEAAHFFKLFSDAHHKFKIPVAIENPIPHKYATAIIGDYTQIVQPWYFGDGISKKTCLWLYDLPNLKPTHIAKERRQYIMELAPNQHRQKLRSTTFEGLANAMADQWGPVAEHLKAVRKISPTYKRS